MRNAALVGLLVWTAPANAEEVAKGKQLYEEHCAKCHGLKGDGHGRAGRNLDPRPTSFTTVKSIDEEEWFKATKLGTKAIGKSEGMEGFGKRLSDDQIREILSYCHGFKR